MEESKVPCFEACLRAQRRSLDLEPILAHLSLSPETSQCKDNIKKTLEKELFLWDAVLLELPPTAFQDKETSLFNVFRVESNITNEVRSLAFEGEFDMERPMLSVNRISISLTPFLNIHIEGSKNEAWLMRKCHVDIETPQFWEVLKRAYGSFAVSAGKTAGHPVNLVDLNLLDPKEFNMAASSGTQVEAHLKTTRAVKGILKRLRDEGDPEFIVNFRFNSDDSSEQQLLFSWPIKASSLLQSPTDSLNLATPNMAVKPPPAVSGSSTSQRRRKLTPTQLDQVWRTGSFDVASKLFPDSSHVWKLSTLLLHGVAARKQQLYRWLGLSLDQAAQTLFSFHMPLQPSQTITLLKSARRILRGLYNCFACTLGVPEEDALIPGHHVQLLVRAARWEFLAESLQLALPPPLPPAPVRCAAVDEGEASSLVTCLPEPKDREPVPVVLHSSSIGHWSLVLQIHEAGTRLTELIGAVQRIWRKERLSIATREELRLRGTRSQGSEAALLAELTGWLEGELNNRLSAAVLQDSALLALDPSLPCVLDRHIRAVNVVRAEKRKRERGLQEDEQARLSGIRRKHPILCQIGWWWSWQSQVRVDALGHYRHALPELEKEGLSEYAALIRASLEFSSRHEPEVTAHLQKHIKASAVQIWRSRIWRPSHWKIVRISNNFHAEKYENLTASSEAYGWRVDNMICIWVALMKNANYALIPCGLIHGPLSARALVSWRAYVPGRRVNSLTGALEPDPTSKQQTCVSRIRALWRHARRSRQTFESQADTGILGKSFTRLFNRVWNWVFVAFFGTSLVIVLFPALCLLNIVFCAALSASSPAWVAALVVLRWIFSVLVWDLDFTCANKPRYPVFRRRHQALPLLQAVVRNCVLQGLGTAVCVAFRVAVHPVVCISISLLACLRFLWSYCADFLLYRTLIRCLARVPAEDGFLQRRIQGPGLSYTCFHSVSPDEALVGLHCYLETRQLIYWEKCAKALIAKPQTVCRTLISAIFGSFVESPSPNGRLLGGTEEEKKASARYARVARLLQSRQDLLRRLQTHSTTLRQSRADTQETIARGAELVREFVSRHFDSQEQESVWSRFDLQPGSWTELTSHFLREAFHPSFTVPVQDADRLLRLAVEQVDVTAFLRMVEAAVPRDHLDMASPVVSDALENEEWAQLSASNYGWDVDPHLTLGRYLAPRLLALGRAILLTGRSSHGKVLEDDVKSLDLMLSGTYDDLETERGGGDHHIS